MSDAFSLKLANQLSELARLADGVDRWCADNGIAELAPLINVVLDDAVSNPINYGFEDGTEHVIEVRMVLIGGRLRVEVIDDGVAFDPLQKEDADITLGIDERKIGGLGILLVKELMDDVRYAREGNYNHLIMEKAVG
jgi:anti-sigma regulatory factor (Ser/Thr protein kinase)